MAEPKRDPIMDGLGLTRSMALGGEKWSDTAQDVFDRAVQETILLRTKVEQADARGAALETADRLVVALVNALQTIRDLDGTAETDEEATLVKVYRAQRRKCQ